MYLTWLLPLLVLEAAAQSTVSCSTANTASSAPNTNIYQTRSACANRCKGQAAYAVVQFDKCWCSNVAPGATTDPGSCDKSCPGYPSEMCGGDSQYSYVLLDQSRVEAAPSPSSSPAPAAPSSSPAPAAPSSSPAPAAPSSSPSPSPSPSTNSESSDSSSSVDKSPPPPQIITITQTNSQGSKTIIKTVLASAPAASDKPATFRTVTVTGTPAASTDAATTAPAAAAPDANSTPPAAAHHGDGAGLKQGTIAGIAVGGSAAGVFMGLIAFMIWRRYAYGAWRGGRGRGRGEEAEAEVDYFGGGGGGGGGPLVGGATTIRRDNTSASEDSRMGAFSQNKHLCRNSIGSLEDAASEANQVLRVVNPDMPEKL